MNCIKAKPRYKQLEEQLGGKWEYFPFHGWRCDDGRTVWAVATCSCDDGCGTPPRYYCYGGGKSVEVNFKPQAFGLCRASGPF